MIEIIVLMAESVLVSDDSVFSRYTIIPDHRRVWNKLVHFHRQVLHPSLEGCHRTHFSFDVYQVPIELALFGDRNQKQRELLGS